MSEQKRLHDLWLLNHQYEIGDRVYVNKMAREVVKSPKLQPVWEGPFITTKRYGPVFYEVQGRKRSSVLHHDRLKSYKSDIVQGWVARFNFKDQTDTLTIETIQEGETECKESRGNNKPKGRHTLRHAADQDRKNN